MINKRTSSGFTLLEVLIVCAVLSLFLAAAFSALSTGIDAHGEQYETVWAQSQLQISLGGMEEELFETDLDNLSITQLLDPLTSEVETFLCFPTARDADSNFHVSVGNVAPDWQGVIVYSPHYDDNRGKCLRKYVEYGMFNYPVGIDSVSATNLTLSNGIQIDRAGAKRVITGLSSFNVISGAPVIVEIKKQTDSYASNSTITHIMQIGVACRN